MKQKFRKLTFVKVADVMPPEMRHFEAGILAIVNGTYSQIYGGTDITDYSLYVVRGGEITDRVSWYKEDQLTACERQDTALAEEMIERYNFKGK